MSERSSLIADEGDRASSVSVVIELIPLGTLTVYMYINLHSHC